MEHDFIINWFKKNKFQDINKKILKLSLYAKFIFEENKKYNLTGLKTMDEIIDNLIIKSLDPFKFFDNRNKKDFVDIGTGSGIPGVVLALFFDNFNGLLVDANKKKINFINKIIKELDINNLVTKNARIETLAHNSECREKYDFCVSRAFGPFYYSIELGLPFVKKDGFLYIYSFLKSDSLSEGILLHIKNLKGKIKEESGHNSFGLLKEGLLIHKIDSNDYFFPRSFAKIKREAKKIKETKD